MPQGVYAERIMRIAEENTILARTNEFFAKLLSRRNSEGEANMTPTEEESSINEHEYN